MRSQSCTLLAAIALAPQGARAFDHAELDGLWAETTQNRYACTAGSRYQRLDLSTDEKTLTIRTELRSGAKPVKLPAPVTLSVVRTEEHRLVVRFGGHEDPADPLAGDWAISVLGPGVYRWHIVSAHEASRPAPIGVRCEP